MLKALRKKKTARKVWLVVSAAVIVTFIFWGSGAMRTKQESAFAGRIFGRNITFLEYKDALDAVKISALQQFGDKLPEAEKYLNLEQQAWERLILLHEAKERRIKVSDKEVVELIEGYPFFKRNGQFDNRAYNEVLRYDFHIEPRVFEEETRQNLMLSKLYEQVTREITVRNEDIESEYQKANEEVSIYYIASIPSDFSKQVNPSEQDLKDYFAANQLNFKQPLSFNLEYISSESTDKIKDAAARLNKKSDLAKVANDLGLTVKETGLFAQEGAVPGIGWSPEISNLISKFRVGQFSSVILADKTYYILRLKERKEPYIPEFATIKDKVREAFIKDKTRKIAQEKIEGCITKLQELYKKDPKEIDFNKVAKEFGVKSDSTASFKYGSYIEGIGASDIFWMTAQRLRDDEFSEILGTPSAFYIIKPKSKVSIDEKKFETEKAEFAKKLLTQQKQEYFNKFVDNLNKKAQ
jgi:hypothetical protein